MLGYIRKEKVCEIILEELRRVNTEYNAIKDRADIDEQRKRDAFMLHSGQIYITTNIINRVRGEQ